METAGRKTAKIYAFPKGGRAAVQRADVKNGARLRGLDIHPHVEFGGCWYHAAAVAEEKDRQQH